MDSEQDSVSGPPSWRIRPGYGVYLPEREYIAELAYIGEPGAAPSRDEVLPAQEALLDRIIRITARYVARWADHVDAFPLSRQGLPADDWKRAGDLPEDVAGRQRAIDGVFGWLEGHAVPIYGAAIILLHDGYPLFNQHDEIPGSLTLTPRQLAELQDEWEQQGMPRDLYFPFEASHAIVEPVWAHGGVVREQRGYSPRAWERRAAAPKPQLEVPSEEERVRAFLAACQQFIETIMLRRDQLLEPGRPPATDETRQLVVLLREVHRAMRAAQESLTSAREEGREPPEQQ